MAQGYDVSRWRHRTFSNTLMQAIARNPTFVARFVDNVSDQELKTRRIRTARRLPGPLNRGFKLLQIRPAQTATAK